MTRNREVDCDDLRECKHEPEVPVTVDGFEIDHWLCRCGRRVPYQPVEEQRSQGTKEKA